MGTVLLAVVVVQLADPLATGPASPPEQPGTEATPTDGLLYAVEFLAVTDHTVDVYRTGGDGGRVHYWRSAINHTTREYRYAVGDGEAATDFYVDADGAWVRHGNGSWRHVGLLDRDQRFASRAVESPFDAERIATVGVHRVNRTNDSLWLRVEATDQNEVTDVDGNESHTLYEIDASTYRLQRAIEYRDADGQERHAVYEVGGYGTTDVERPAGTRDPLVRLVGDLLR